MTVLAKRIIKRDGTIVEFDGAKIQTAILKAAIEVSGDADKGASSSSARDIAERFSRSVIDKLHERANKLQIDVVHIEEIQDLVELVLMREGEHKLARAYVTYRNARQQERDALLQREAPRESLYLDKAKQYCIGLEGVCSADLAKSVAKCLYDNISSDDENIVWEIEARTLIEKDPNYSHVSARIVLDRLFTRALSYFHLNIARNDPDIYRQYFPLYVRAAIEKELLSDELGGFDLDMLAQAIEPIRDEKFTYQGIKILEDRYLQHTLVGGKDVRIELPQAMLMRVAMGLALHEEHKNERAIEFYSLLSTFDYMSSTPTLFNAGTCRPQLSSCYLTSVPDDLFGIYTAIRDNAMLSKYAGGLGNDWTPVRSLGARIKGTNGKSQGVVPFLKVANDTAVAVNQGGKRKGAACAYLETWHLDIEEFLELRKNVGDDRRRTHDMNTANWVPDLFMKRVFENGYWTLFSPHLVPDLHEIYGKQFEERYVHYESMADEGKLQPFKRIKAVDLWRKMLGMLFETGHPWISFKDPCNIRSPQQHCGTVHSSNLCTEITLNTKAGEEIAVCNLGSVNLANHIEDGKLNRAKLKATINTAVRMLDNVIDINFYSVEQAQTANFRHRPVGLGIMGFHDALYQCGITYASSDAVEFADHSMELVSYFALQASCNLAQERGKYSSFDGSLWSKGVLPIDSQRRLQEERGSEYCQFNFDMTENWEELRDKIKSFGLRNSNVLAIAPTATIANICDVSQSIEPEYQNLYTKSNLSGEFIKVNKYLVQDLKALGIWDSVMIDDLKYFEGSVQEISRIPDSLKEKYRTAFEIEPRFIVESAARRQKWIDQAQSLNLYINEANGKKLDTTYKMAFLLGVKTTYYLRAISATSVEKSTVNRSTLNAVKATDDTPTKACSIQDTECEACQ